MPTTQARWRISSNFSISLTQHQVESALEMSKRGGHLWIFLAVPLPARKCRIYIYDVAQQTGITSEGIRVG